ncbi:MAG TPA: hydrogenase formation protein HypD, partial [Myxococcota bacterium]|nr:hydrogenase formation protein HypD [Myxococcota bacterium]
MRFVEEYRDARLARALAADILRRATRSWTIMEVCGGQTHAILQYGLDELIAPAVSLLHGPGCPVCVTPLETLDLAVAIAERTDAVVCTFGDMLRVPGSKDDLLSARARGGDVRVVYAPLDAARLAERMPERRVVFLAVGFETTAPAVAVAARFARARKLENFSLLVSHVRVPPALEAIAGAPDSRVQAFLAAGHVCTVMG